MVCAGIFIIGSRYFLSLPTFSGTQTFYTTLDNAGGLISGNAVYINGVLVGAIRNVGLAENGNVRIDFTVNKGIDITHGSKASIGGLALLGVTRLDITLNTADTTHHVSGDWIPGDQDDELTALMSTIPTLLNHTDSLIVSTDNTIDVAGELMGNPDSDLRRTLLAIQETANAVSNLLQKEQQHLSGALQGITALSGSLNTLARDSLTVTVGELHALIDHIDAYIDTLEETTTSLDVLLQTLNSSESTLGKLINDDALYIELETTLSRINHILTDFQQNPGKYLKDLRLVDIL